MNKARDKWTKKFSNELIKFCKEKGFVSNGVIGYATGLFAKLSNSYAEEYHREKSKWVSVEEIPLFTKDEKGNWTCTDDGDNEFIAAVPYLDKRHPNETLWWVRHCLVADEIGLCVVSDDDYEKAGWELEDIKYWKPFNSEPPK